MLAKLSSSSSSAPSAFLAAVGLLLLVPLCFAPGGAGGGAPGSVSSPRACPAFGAAWGSCLIRSASAARLFFLLLLVFFFCTGPMPSPMRLNAAPPCGPMRPHVPGFSARAPCWQALGDEATARRHYQLLAETQELGPLVPLGLQKRGAQATY
jgi:hypothetical protein